MNNLQIIYSQTISIPIKETYKVLNICQILLNWIVSQFDMAARLGERVGMVKDDDERCFHGTYSSNQFN